MEHTKNNPTHGVGCACLDKHAGSIKMLLREKGYYRYQEPRTDTDTGENYVHSNFDHPSWKALQNFKVVLSYL